MDPSFVAYIKGSRILLLQETWACEGFSLSGYKGFYLNAHQNSLSPGRPQGGLATLVSLALNLQVEQIDIQSSSMLGVKLQTAEEVFVVINVYLHPTYKKNLVDQRWRGIQLTLETLLEKYPEASFLVAGDFNGRLSHSDKSLFAKYNKYPPLPILTSDLLPRNFKDSVATYAGFKCRQTLMALNFHLLNGALSSDYPAEFTFWSGSRASTIDFIWTSVDLIPKISNFRVVTRLESDHFPLELSLTLDGELATYSCVPITNNQLQMRPTALKWTDNLAQRINELLRSDQLQETRDSLVQAVEPLPMYDKLVDLLKPSLTKASVMNSNHFSHKKWFDEECRHFKNNLYNEFLAYRASNDPAPSSHLMNLKRRYKALLKEKKLAAERNDWNNLLKAAENRNPSSFWHQISQYLGRPWSRIEPQISADTWESFFSDLYAAHAASGERIELAPLPEWDPVTCSEVETLIGQFEAGKAPGDDLISIDVIKANKDWWCPPLAALFTYINKTAQFPPSWNSALIVLIHKKGPRTDPANFRPISLLNVIGKIYSRFLLNKLTTWMESNNIIAEEQAGFRPGRSTTDQILILNHLATKYADNGLKALHVAFIDFKQAFDLIPRNQLWAKLAATSIDRRLLLLIINLHTNTFLRIRLDSKGLVSNPVATTRGVRQGCLLAPALFNFYINSLVVHMANTDFHPPKLAGRALNVLLYADDAALLATSPIGLRRMLRALHEYVTQHELQLNYAKTKIMVFAARPKPNLWSINGIPLEQVSCFKYLGQVVRSNRSFLAHREYIASNASKAALVIRTLYSKKQAQTVKVALRLFKMKVLPLLLVGIALGSRRDFEKLESIQTQFLRAILRIPPSVAGAIMRLETGCQAFRYVALKAKLWLWLKLCFRPVGLAPLILRDNFKSPWEGEIVEEVQKCGLSSLYIESMTYSHAKAVIAQRLRDIARQEDIARVKPGLFLGEQMYRAAPARYLADIHYVEYRRLFTAARLNVLDSAVLKGRYGGVPYDQRLCHCALGEVESTEHILMSCPFYNDLRQYLITPYLPQLSPRQRGKQTAYLLNKSSRKTTLSVAKFLFLALKRRKRTIECLDVGYL